MNNKVKKSLDNILPSSNSKQRILNNILCYKKKYFLKPLITVSTVFVGISLLFVFDRQSDNDVVSVPSRINNSFYYNNICYEEIGKYEGSLDNLVESLENENSRESFYEIKNSKNIVIFFEDYTEYKLCEGESENEFSKKN